MRRRKSYRWHFREDQPAAASALVATLGVNPAVARVLANRGYLADSAQLGTFLRPSLSNLRDPFLMRDMDRAIARIGRAIDCGEKITVYGDYDVDGITSTALLVRAFRELGCKAEYYIPHRIDEGYGLRADALTKLAADGTRLVVTVDNGITAVEQIAHGVSLGLDIVVTDHHQPGPELPAALAVVNPNRRDCNYPNKHLAGVGVAFKVAHALMKSRGVPAPEATIFLRSVLDLVALGTIADVAPLVDENRVLVKHGLERVVHSTNQGVQALKRALEMEGSRVTTHKVGFQIAPRLNAAGRTDHASICVELLTTPDSARADDIVSQLEVFNTERRSVEARIFELSMEFVQREVDLDRERVLVVAGDDWHVGVIGIVASRMLDVYDRPVIIVSRQGDQAKGSARSIPGFNIHDALEACGAHLIGFGGHPGAAGLQIETDRIPAFREAMNAYARERLEPTNLVPSLTIDAEIAARDLDFGLMQDLALLEPFGQSNPAPVFSICGLRLAEQPRVVGNGHLRLQLGAGKGCSFGAIGFNLGDFAAELSRSPKATIDVAFVPTINTFYEPKVEMELKDLRIHSED